MISKEILGKWGYARLRRFKDGNEVYVNYQAIKSLEWRKDRTLVEMGETCIEVKESPEEILYPVFL